MPRGEAKKSAHSTTCGNTPSERETSSSTTPSTSSSVTTCTLRPKRSVTIQHAPATKQRREPALRPTMRQASMSADYTPTGESSSTSTLTTANIPQIVTEALQSAPHPADSRDQEDQGSSRYSMP